MFAPRLLTDNDALLKAAHWGLLEVVPTLLGATWPEVACLPQFPPRVRRAEPKLFADARVARELEARLNQIAPLPDPAPDMIAKLQGEPGIDVGEMLLVGALAASPYATLLTGDKRALVALAKTSAILLCNQRFICVEQLLWHALDQLGAPALVARVRQWTPRDQTALAIFGSQGEKTEGDLRAGLQSYLRWLDGEAPGLLVRSFGL